MYKKLIKYLPQILLISVIAMHTQFAVAFFWVMFHELIHCAVSYKLNVKKEKIGVHALGAYLKQKDLDYISPNQDILISLSGPMANMAASAFFYLLSFRFSGSFITLSYESNLALMMFNLLPAFPLDGARILRAYLSKKRLYKQAYKFTVYCSFVVSFLLSTGFIFLLFFNKINITLGLSSVFILMFTLKEKKRMMYIIMGDIVKKRNRFLKQKFLENKSISVHYELSLVNVIGLIDKNKYNHFTVLNDEMQVLGVLYEEDIILGAKDFGNITIEELMEKIEDIHRFRNI
ncbi:site-2 protease family protein [Clostridium polynesiense]|uniref:site-2 protease family protein n=1 Tax=Clostridium polynesiense TaxID=1325933 RepID=UPI000694175D|nr:site-2 protease family protein [Clostridium polynesiense]